jgi:esterase/lipase
MYNFLQLNSKNKIHYYVIGKGKPLILLPSMWVTSRSYLTLGKVLSRNYKVYIPDIYRGRSIFNKNTNKLVDYENWLTQFINKLKIKDFYLVGISLSGMITNKYLNNPHPNPKRVFLVSTTILPPDLVHRRTTLLFGYIRLLYHNLFSVYGIKTNMLWTTDALVNIFRHPGQMVAEGKMAIDLEINEVGKIPVETKLLFASKDEFLPYKSVEKLKKVRNLSVEKIDGCHCWFFGKEEMLANKIKDFFELI